MSITRKALAKVLVNTIKAAPAFDRAILAEALRIHMASFRMSGRIPLLRDLLDAIEEATQPPCDSTDCSHSPEVMCMECLPKLPEPPGLHGCHDCGQPLEAGCIQSPTNGCPDLVNWIPIPDPDPQPPCIHCEALDLHTEEEQAILARRSRPSQTVCGHQGCTLRPGHIPGHTDH